MNIKEIFERERIYRATTIDSYEHNKCIDRIEAAVTKHVEGLEAQVAVKPALKRWHWWKLLFFKITGGRPMFDDGYNFTDRSSGKSVRNYIDRFGRKWMADSGPWSSFRVRRHGL